MVLAKCYSRIIANYMLQLILNGLNWEITSSYLSPDVRPHVSVCQHHINMHQLQCLHVWTDGHGFSFRLNSNVAIFCRI